MDDTVTAEAGRDQQEEQEGITDPSNASSSTKSMLSTQADPPDNPTTLKSKANNASKGKLFPLAGQFTGAGFKPSPNDRILTINTKVASPSSANFSFTFETPQTPTTVLPQPDSASGTNSLSATSPSFAPTLNPATQGPSSSAPNPKVVFQPAQASNPNDPFGNGGMGARKSESTRRMHELQSKQRIESRKIKNMRPRRHVTAQQPLDDTKMTQQDDDEGDDDIAEEFRAELRTQGLLGDLLAKRYTSDIVEPESETAANGQGRNVVASLEDEIADLKRTIATLQKIKAAEIERRDGEIARLRALNTAFQEDNLANIEQKQKEIETLHLDIAANLQERTNELQQQKDREIEFLNAEYTAHLQNQANELQEKNREIEGLKETGRTLEQQYHQSIDKPHNELNEEQLQRVGHTLESALYQEKFAAAQTQISTTEAVNRDLEITIAEYERRFNVGEQDIFNLRQESDRYKQQVQELQGQLSTSENQVLQSTDYHTKQSEQQSARHKQQIDELESSLRQYQIEIQNLHANTHYQAEVANLTSLLIDAQHAVSEHEKQKQAFENHICDLEHQLVEAESQRTEARHETSSTIEQQRQLQLEISDLLAQVQPLQFEADFHRDEREKHKEEIIRLTNLLSRAEAHRRPKLDPSFDNHNSSFTAHLDDIEVSELEKILTEQSNKITEQARKIAGLETRLAVSRKMEMPTNAEVARQIANLKRELDKALDNCSHIETQLAEEKSEHEKTKKALRSDAETLSIAHKDREQAEANVLRIQKDLNDVKNLHNISERTVERLTKEGEERLKRIVELKGQVEERTTTINDMRKDSLGLRKQMNEKESKIEKLSHSLAEAESRVVEFDSVERDLELTRKELDNAHQQLEVAKKNPAVEYSSDATDFQPVASVHDVQPTKRKGAKEKTFADELFGISNGKVSHKEGVFGGIGDSDSSDNSSSDESDNDFGERNSHSASPPRRHKDKDVQADLHLVSIATVFDYEPIAAQTDLSTTSIMDASQNQQPVVDIPPKNAQSQAKIATAQSETSVESGHIIGVQLPRVTQNNLDNSLIGKGSIKDRLLSAPSSKPITAKSQAKLSTAQPDTAAGERNVSSLGESDTAESKSDQYTAQLDTVVGEGNMISIEEPVAAQTNRSPNATEEERIVKTPSPSPSTFETAKSRPGSCTTQPEDRSKQERINKKMDEIFNSPDVPPTTSQPITFKTSTPNKNTSPAGAAQKLKPDEAADYNPNSRRNRKKDKQAAMQMRDVQESEPIENIAPPIENGNGNGASTTKPGQVAPLNGSLVKSSFPESVFNLPYDCCNHSAFKCWFTTEYQFFKLISVLLSTLYWATVDRAVSFERHDDEVEVGSMDAVSSEDSHEKGNVTDTGFIGSLFNFVKIARPQAEVISETTTGETTVKVITPTLDQIILENWKDILTNVILHLWAYWIFFEAFTMSWNRMQWIVANEETRSLLVNLLAYRTHSQVSDNALLRACLPEQWARNVRLLVLGVCELLDFRQKAYRVPG